MEWVPLSGYETGVNLDDRPRRLTEEEIRYVVNHLPTAPSADSTAAAVARDGIIEWIYSTLKEVNLCPSAIPSLIELMVQQHYKSLAIPGTSSGITAAEAVGATTMQMTLNSVAPWEKILIQDATGILHVHKIGEWIDKLMLEGESKIHHIPENRTQYLKLTEPVSILSPDEDGNIKWSPITAITKHLPVGEMVKITTQSGRSVTATQSKSLLVWDGTKLVQRDGNSVKVGELVPIIHKIKINNLSKIPVNDEMKIGTIWFDNYSNLSTFNPLIQVFVNFITSFSDETLKVLYEKYKDVVMDNDIILLMKSRLGIVSADSIIKNDIVLDPIVSVEQVPATEYVYDLTVPSTTNFSLMNGLGVADTFHTSGSSKSASFGIDSMRDLIFARKNPKNESCTIYYTNKTLSYEQVLDTRRYIVGSMVSSFVRNYDIDSPNVLQRFWWHDAAPALLKKNVPPSTKVLRLFLDIAEMYKYRVTIAELAIVLEREVPPSVVAVYGPIGDGIIDLYPHPELIGKVKDAAAVPPELLEITYLETVVYPELKNIRVKGIAGIKQLYPIVSPVWRIVMLERKLALTDINDPALQKELAPHIGNAWRLFYNHDIMEMTGLIPENLAALCQLAGCRLLPSDPKCLNIVVPNDRFRTPNNTVVYKINGNNYIKLDETTYHEEILYRKVSNDDVKLGADGIWTEKIDEKLFEVIPSEQIRQINKDIYREVLVENLLEINNDMYEKITNRDIKITEMKPSEYIQGKVIKDKAQRKLEIKEATDARIEDSKLLPEVQRRAYIRTPVNIPRSQLVLASEFVIAETDGSNFKELLALPGIDKKRTTCNNMYTIAATLGIEAARTFFIRALSNTIANTGSYVHPANIILIAEFIASRGEPYGATYTGISRQPGGHLSLATLERAGKVFTQSALHGRKEDIRNVSASVAVGARMAIGSGYFDIGQNITENGVVKTILNDDLFTALARDDASNELLKQTEIQAPSGNEDLTGALDILKTLTTAGTFDYIGDEKGTNLGDLFNQGETVADTGKNQTFQAEVPQGIVRRVQATPANQVSTNELFDVLNTIKIGIPITPLETGVPTVKPMPLPIVSEGLYPFVELMKPITTEIGIPNQLQTLFTMFDDETTQEPMETVIVNLPQVEIPMLPDLEGFNFTTTNIEARREQIRDLNLIDTTALINTLK